MKYEPKITPVRYYCDPAYPTGKDVGHSVFLSEEEALQVIREEAKAQGVQFSGTKIIEGDEFPATAIMYGQDPGSSTWSGMLELDGYDAVLNIGCEFVSKVDVVSWEKREGVITTADA